MLFFFVFKQKTAYEVRISDWSSDVCSSDLARDIDMVVVVARSMLPHFDSFDCPRIFIPHGVDLRNLRRPTVSPYDRPHNAVAVGSMLFDEGAIRTLAQAVPHFTFHMIGTPRPAFP